jgi:hypothetical protein
MSGSARRVPIPSGWVGPDARPPSPIDEHAKRQAAISPEAFVSAAFIASGQVADLIGRGRHPATSPRSLAFTPSA